jgi:hypothetical protein
MTPRPTRSPRLPWLPKPIRAVLRRIRSIMRTGLHASRAALHAARIRAIRAMYSVRLGRLRPGVRPLAESEIRALRDRDPYYRGREGYLTIAAGLASELIKRDGLRTALELGPNLRPLLYGADVMDYVSRPGLELEGRVIIQDAKVTPWPVSDGEYDLFVALQVFEHLGTAQPEAFREVARIARHAILSLPIDWVLEDTNNVHHGLTHEKVLTWFLPRTPTRIVEGNPGKRKRIIYVFENLRPS